MLKRTPVSVIRLVESAEQGSRVVEETLDPSLDAAQARESLEWVRGYLLQAQRFDERQRVLSLRAAEGVAALDAITDDGALVPASELAARRRARDVPWNPRVFLSLASRWITAARTQGAVARVAGVRGRWLIDVDQLAVAVDGRLCFGHGRIHSVFDLLWLESFGTRAIPPMPTLAALLPMQGEPASRAAVKELAFALLELASGARPLRGETDVERLSRWSRGELGVDAASLALGPSSDAVFAVLARAAAFDPRARFDDVRAFEAAFRAAMPVDFAEDQAIALALAALASDASPSAPRGREDQRS